jgi:nicotinamide-nucleotide amidase
MFAPALIERAAALLALCRDRGLKLATAESCTGGLVAGLLTEIPGSSAVVERGFVVYSNLAKREMLGVPEETLARWGAVSAETARAMVKGALSRSAADIVVAVTGVAGPDGGTTDKPVGLVHFASARLVGEPTGVERRFGPLSRGAIRLASVEMALEMLEAAARQAGARP